MIGIQKKKLNKLNILFRMNISIMKYKTNGS